MVLMLVLMLVLGLVPVSVLVLVPVLVLVLGRRVAGQARSAGVTVSHLARDRGRHNRAAGTQRRRR